MYPEVKREEEDCKGTNVNGAAKYTDAQYRLIDNLLAAVSTSSEKYPKSPADVFGSMAFRKDFYSIAGMTFMDVVHAAVKLGLVTFDRERNLLFLKC